jgi:hypothetical protein
VGGGGVAPDSAGGPAARLEKQGREGLAASSAVAVQANMILLVPGLWSNSESELSQEINAQNGTSNSCLQETGSKKFALKLDSFYDESPRGDYNLFAPSRRGPDGLVLDAHGIMLNVAPVSTKYLSLVNLSVRKSIQHLQEMHGCGHRVCSHCCRASKGLAAL